MLRQTLRQLHCKIKKAPLSGAFLFGFFLFRHTLHSNAINERVVKPHRYKHPAFVAIAVFLRHPDNIAHSGFRTRPGNIPVPTLFPKQPGMLFAEPDKSRYHLLFIDQADAVIDADMDGQLILRHVPFKITHEIHLWNNYIPGVLFCT